MTRVTLLSLTLLAGGCFEKIDILAGTPLAPTDAGLPKPEAQRCTVAGENPDGRDAGAGSSTRTCAFPRDPTGKIEAVVGTQQCVGGFWTECKAAPSTSCTPLPAGYPCLSSMRATCSNWPCSCQAMRCVGACKASFGSGPTGNLGLVFDAACATSCGATNPVFCPISDTGCNGDETQAELGRLCGGTDAGPPDARTEPGRDLQN
jgi:hypothetical protein